MRVTRKIEGLLALLALLCAPRPGAAQTLQGAGATFPYPIYKQWFANFQKATNIAVNYQAVGSGAGYKNLLNKTVDFAASDAPLTAEEEKALPGPVVHIPTVGGAVVLTYNLPSLGSGVRFTSEVIAGIFLGKIKNWNDPALKAANPSLTLPDLPIQSVHRTDGSGTTYIFTNYLKKASAAWASQIGAGKSVNWPGGLSGKGNAGVAATIQRTPGGVGYVELAYAIEQKLAYGSVRNQAGNFVAPSVASTAYAIGKYLGELKKDIKTPTVDAPGVNSYPICSLTYILIYKNGSGNTGPATKLWDWAMQPEQQDAVKALYYAPLPEELRALNKATLKSLPGAQVSLRSGTETHGTVRL